MGLFIASFQLFAVQLLASINWESLGSRAWQIGSVACGLGFVIFVHELGHFLVAKWCGVKCEKFYVGFDVPIKILGFQLPSKLFHFQWGETEYGIGIIPLGGYVKMLGQDDDPRAAQAEMERIRVKKSNDEPADSGASTEESSNSEAQATASRANADQAPADDEYELDPRSFPAKTVPQRMAIISAGVIMNLIFAVIFASLAYSKGVPYTPCEVGRVMPGTPAWIAGVQEQSRIVQVGDEGKRKSFLRFTWDLKNNVAMADAGNPVTIITQDDSGKEQTYEVVPKTIQPSQVRRRLFGIFPLPPEEIKQLGIGSASTNRLNATPPVIPKSSAATASVPLVGKDEIVAVNDVPVANAYQVTAQLAANPTEPITLTVRREKLDDAGKKSTETVKTIIEPNPLLRVGLIMKSGPVSAIRPDSPAQAAGLKIGDVIETINGEAITDPISLPSQIRPFHDQVVEVQVRRGDELVSLQVTPGTPSTFDWDFFLNSPMSCVSLGAAFDVIPVVQAVIPDSPADQAGIKPGDTAVSFVSQYDAPKDRNEEKINRKSTPSTIDGKNITWQYFIARCQKMPEGTSIHVTVKRAGATLKFPLKPTASDDLNPDRGLVLGMKTETYVAKSWGEAISLGASRTKEDAMRVATFLKKLVTGRIALTNLGGPLVIAAVAGSEASEGLPRLLIFLTFLSANLAVVNFMPIPALDGGHFVFLLWEGISGKPVNERVQIALTLAGVGCLLCLMVFVVSLDIDRLFF